MLPSSRISPSSDSQIQEEDYSESSYFRKELAKIEKERKRPGYPLGAFCLFSQIRRTELKAAQPKQPQKKIYARIKREWRELSDKSYYQALAKKDYQAYLLLLDKWEQVKEEGRPELPATDEIGRIPSRPPIQSQVADLPLAGGTGKANCSSDVSRRQRDGSEISRSALSVSQSLRSDKTHSCGEGHTDSPLVKDLEARQKQTARQQPQLIIVIDLEKEEDNPGKENWPDHRDPSPKPKLSPEGKPLARVSSEILPTGEENLVKNPQALPPAGDVNTGQTCQQDDQNLQFSLLDEQESEPSSNCHVYSTKGGLGPLAEASLQLYEEWTASPRSNTPQPAHAANLQHGRASIFQDNKIGKRRLPNFSGIGLGYAEIGSCQSKRRCHQEWGVGQHYLQKRKLTE